MATFFSGTDTNTLKEEGSDINHFVSLIVNNAGTYSAAITRKADIKNDVYSVYTYKSFGDVAVEGKSDYTECNTCIEYFYLDIEVEQSENNNSELFDRIGKLKESKNKSPLSPPYYNYKYPDYNSETNKYTIPKIKEDMQKKEFEQKELFTDYKEKELTEWYVKQLLTCNLLVPKNNKVSINEIAERSNSFLEPRFNNEEYEHFMSNFIDFIVYDFTERLEELRKEPGNPAEAASLLFDKILPLKGSYINILTDLLEAYI